MTEGEMLVDDAERLEAVAAAHAGRDDADGYFERMLRAARTLRDRAAVLAEHPDRARYPTSW